MTKSQWFRPASKMLLNVNNLLQVSDFPNLQDVFVPCVEEL